MVQFSVLKTGIDFTHFGLESGFRGNYDNVWRDLSFQYQKIKKERVISEFEMKKDIHIDINEWTYLKNTISIHKKEGKMQELRKDKLVLSSIEFCPAFGHKKFCLSYFNSLPLRTNSWRLESKCSVRCLTMLFIKYLELCKHGCCVFFLQVWKRVKWHFLVWNRVRIWITGWHTPTKNSQGDPRERREVNHFKMLFLGNR